MSYYLTKQAVEDLAEIWNYTLETWSEQQADKYYQMLLSICSEIANDPTSGKNYSQLAVDLFGIRVNRHIIFYRVLSSTQVEITRILHERMDLNGG